MEGVMSPIPCPSCGEKLDGWICLDGNSRPEPGDVTVCATCGTPLVFVVSGDSISFRTMTSEERAQVAVTEPLLQMAIEAVDMHRRARAIQ